MTDEERKGTMTVPEVCKALGIRRNFCYLHQEELGAVKIGRKVLVPRVAIEAILNGAWLR